MFEIALAELARLARIPAPEARERQASRDVLLVALLLACPNRERDLAQMGAGRHLAWLGDEWHLRLEPHETRTGQALHLVVPATLPLTSTTISPASDRVSRAPRAMPASDPHRRAPPWPRRPSSLMSWPPAHLVGTVLNPHSFRSFAAILLAMTSPEGALHARPLLGHRQMETTEKHYVRASQLAARRKLAKALLEIRDGE